MEWRTIPGFEAYEVNTRGKVRRVASKYCIEPRGRQVRLWDGTGYLYFRPLELVGLAFAQPGEEAAPISETIDAEPEEMLRLRARVAELEAELAVYRVEF